ncbi:BMP family protein [Leptolyngbya sp. PCC 6406]|uniref:BMP family protein n=1 Tax=Leptolyngbya sp. PCC 6406 TaxID=1173264 RepID=UPI0002ACF6D9|nr:BMP family protein [Leptolyngbya sp. PCC 6406]
MRIKSLLTNLLLAIATLTLAISCGTAPSDTPSAGDTNPDGRLRVAMITTGSESDGSWSQAGYEGLKLIEKTFNAEIAFSGFVNDGEGEESLRQYAEEGYDFIIAQSGGYIENAETVADEFPRTKFAIVTTYPGNNRNLGAVAFRSGEVGYLSGVLAAMTTETNKVAYMVGHDYPVYQEEAALFEKGVKETNPDVEVVTEFLQTWTDGERGKEVALALAEQGFDRFAINADEAGIEAIHAIADDDTYNNVKVIGWTGDQYDIAPDHVITSVLQDIPRLILNAADLFQQGRWEGKLYKFGLKEEIYGFAPFRGALNPEDEAAFEDIKNKVMIGEIDISPT